METKHIKQRQAATFFIEFALMRLLFVVSISIYSDANEARTLILSRTILLSHFITRNENEKKKNDL